MAEVEKLEALEILNSRGNPTLKATLTLNRVAGQLNGNQQRRLVSSCEYIDKLLSDIDDMLHEAKSPSPFPRHIVDVSPAQIRVLENYIRRIRSQLVRTIAWQNINPKPAGIPATRAILSYLAFVDITIEELKPKYMKGYGAVRELGLGP